MSWVPVLSLLIPFGTGLILLLKRDSAAWQKPIGLIGNTAMIINACLLIGMVEKTGVVVYQMGNWKAPFGIVLAIDMLGAIMTLITALVSISALIYAFDDISAKRMKGSFYALYFFMMFGINGAFLTGDLFNLFVFYEVVLLTSYVLLVLGNEDQQVKSGFVYLVLNFMGSTLFLAGAGILYRQLGTLNMAHIALRVGEVQNQGLITIVAILFLFVFGLKSAIFPIFNWLPGSYTAPPTPVAAVFAGLLTKVGLYSMYRTFGTIFTHDVLLTHHAILIPLAGLTMLFGVWGAVVQYDISKILAFHSISQVGYILMGLAIYAPLAITGGIFHMIHHSIIKSSLFLLGGKIGKETGTQELKQLGGLVEKSGFLAILFMISALALSGIPPLSGFFSKYTLILSGLQENHPWLVFAALLTGLFTLYSMIKIWRLCFWGSYKSPQPSTHSTQFIGVACAISVIFVLSLTFFINPIMKYSKIASDQLMDRKEYIKAVLSKAPMAQKGRPI